MSKPEDYKDEYRKYQSSTKQIKERAQRVMARRKVKKELGAAAISGKEVHHKVSPKAGGTNAMSNLQLMSRAKNRELGNKRR